MFKEYIIISIIEFSGSKLVSLWSHMTDSVHITNSSQQEYFCYAWLHIHSCSDYCYYRRLKWVFFVSYYDV